LSPLAAAPILLPVRPPRSGRPPRASRHLFGAVAVLAVLALVAIACTHDTTTTTGTGPTRQPWQEDPTKFTEGYINKTFTLDPNRSDVTRPTAPPISAHLPGNVPIKQVIFVIKENRTYDHFFGRYPAGDGVTEGKTLDGTVVPLGPAPDVTDALIVHGFWSGLYSIDGGRMDGFDTIDGGELLEGYTQFDRRTLPHYFDYADRFVLTDRFFTSEYGPTFPEHLYTVAAQSDGIMDNKSETTVSPGRYCDDPNGYSPAFPQDLPQDRLDTIMAEQNRIVDDHPDAMNDIRSSLYTIRACLEIPTLPQRLSEAGVSWKFYSDPVFPIGDIMRAIKPVRYSDLWNNVVASDSFLDDITKGNLAQVSWVNPPAPNNEHPILPNRIQSVCAGENWTVQMMNDLQNSPYWKSTAVIEVWDDFGGYYDHVPPPQYDIMGLGARTPGLIMSPYTIHGDNRLGGAVDHHTYEFSSVLAFIEQLFGIDPLTARDAQADPLTGAFDFSRPPDMHKLILPLRQDCPYGTAPPFLHQDNLLPPTATPSASS
jgi:phospholipase C